MCLSSSLSVDRSMLGIFDVTVVVGDRLECVLFLGVIKLLVWSDNASCLTLKTKKSKSSKEKRWQISDHAIHRIHVI